MKKDETLSLQKLERTKKWGLTFLFLIFHSLFLICAAQCSICTKTAQQLGEGPAKGLNAGILYLAFAPFAIVGFVAFRWWKNSGQKINS